MRRGHRPPPRPPLARKAVVALPTGDAVGALDAFRARHDARSAQLPAHVTLVFPFATSLTALQVRVHVQRVASHWPAIPIRLGGVGCYHGEWVHLRVTRGAQAIVELHDRLYRRALAPFLRHDLPYEPHVTVGRARDAAEAEAIGVAARAAFDRPLDFVLRALTIVSLSPAGAIAREGEIALG